METPATPISERAAADAQRSVGAHGADMEKFFGGMMAHGGMPDISQTLGRMDQLYGQQQQDMINQLKASGLPLNSSAMAQAMGGALSQGAQQHNLARGMLEMDQMNQAMGRQFQGAAGLGSMPSYFGQPSSIEQAMFGMQMPYDLARIQGLGNAYGQLWGQNYYTPTYIEGPSPYEMYVDPFLGPILEGLAGMLGSALLGGVG